MDTCLYSAFSSVYTLVENLGQNFSKTAFQKLVLQLQTSYEIVPIKEKHFNLFLQAISCYITDKGECAQKLYEAYGTAGTCRLCVSCRGCARSFYAQILRKLFSDIEIRGSYTQWIEVIDNYDKINQFNFNKVENYLLRHLEETATALEFYQSKYEQTRGMTSLNYKLINLKGLSSSTPTLYNNTFQSNYSGGGFYINWDGLGIAVDPGYNFVSNMHQHGLFIHDIDVVIVTHEHMDHTADIRTIDDINYQLNMMFFKDNPHKIRWYWDEETDKIFRYVLSGNPANEFVVIKELEEDFQKNSPVTVKGSILLRPFKTRHVAKSYEPICYEDNTFGFVLELQRRNQSIKIGYTSDTAYFSELPQCFYDNKIVIANISSINKEDLLYEKQKDTHLGFMGCISLLRQMKSSPQLFVVSEFWCGKADIRFDIAKYISSELHKTDPETITQVVPAEVGLSVDLTSMKILCSCCSRYSDSIHIVSPTSDFEKIRYFCSECSY